MRAVLALPIAGALLGALVAAFLDPSFVSVGAVEGSVFGGIGALLLWMKRAGVGARWLGLVAALIAVGGPLLVLFPLRRYHDGGFGGLAWIVAAVALAGIVMVLAIGYRALDLVPPAARAAVLATVSLTAAAVLPWLDVGARMERRETDARNRARAKIARAEELKLQQRDAEERTRRAEERARRRIPGRPLPQAALTDCTKQPTALIAAVEARSPRAVKQVLGRGANPDEGCDFGEGTGDYPLSMALALGEPEIGRALLEAGAHPDLAGPGAPLPLASAIEHGQLDVARELIKRGADVDAKNNGTPLVMIAAASSLPALELLLQAGANPDVMANGRTPLTVAIGSGHQEIAKRLRAEGARQ